MTKKKNMIARICGLLIVLTLISCCFLGSTFARYTSSGDGTASVQVAKWDIDITTGGQAATTITANFGKLSPNMTGYNSVSPADVSNPTPGTEIATIANNGEVNALVTAELGTMTVYFADGSSQIVGEDADTLVLGTASDNTLVTLGEVADLFTITLYRDHACTAAFDTKGVEVVAKNGETVTAVPVYAIVAWTTKYTETKTDGVHEDALDTWVGENVTSISWAIDLTAVQYSELPA